jgi:predicted DNA-binding transcriptional regulator AlpA
LIFPVILWYYYSVTKTVKLENLPERNPTMTGQEVMTLLNITRPIFYRMIEDGDLRPTNLPTNKFQKRPRRFLFDRAAVERLAREGVPGAKPDAAA